MKKNKIYCKLAHTRQFVSGWQLSQQKCENTKTCCAFCEDHESCPTRCSCIRINAPIQWVHCKYRATEQEYIFSKVFGYYDTGMEVFP